MSPSTNKNKKRMIVVFIIACIMCTILTFRVGWIQVVSSEKYTKLAVEQQTRDVPIPAKRGIIYDRNGKELAVSAVTHSIWVRPSVVRGDKPAKAEANVDKVVKNLSETLGMDQKEVRDIVTQKRSLVKVSKYVDKEKSDKIREAKLPGVEIAEDVKRYYPMGAFASHLLGSVTDDNRGLAGIEMKYNNYLSGLPGRWIKSADLSGNSLTYGVEKYYQAENGLNVVLTLDEVIQHIAEKAIATVQANTQADMVEALVMDPKTGDVLAMAATPEYDPNNPRVPLDPAAAKYVEGLPNNEKLNYWNAMWRNPLISDVYEPGSTFKLLTTAMSLEEGVTSLSDHFVCTGRYDVSGTILKCWRYYNPHGAETLTQAVGNSCNPVFIQLAQRLGMDKYYKYLDLFGITERTGIDFPGEGYAILQNKKTAGPVGLATMSYGQGIAVTPIQLTTAISALGNKGKLMQPRLVKELTDNDGNVIEKYDVKEVRQIVSKQTSDEMCLIMEAVVDEGGSKQAKVSGYRIGGKTGTANKAKNGKYSEETCSSFIGMAPMDDPKITVLVVVNNPKGTKFGSTTALPGGKIILEESLRYLNVQPSYSQEELAIIDKDLITVPELTGKSYSQVKSEYGNLGVSFIVSPEQKDQSDFNVVDQYPKAGEKVVKGGAIYLYRN